MRSRFIALISVMAMALAAAVPAVASDDVESAEFLVVLDDGLTAEFEEAVADAGGTIAKYFDQIDVAVVSAPVTADFGGFGAVTLNHSVAGPDTMVVEGPSADEVAIQAAQTPFTGDDDFLFDRQWAPNTVRSQEAWAAGSTGAGARVFVLDEGFDMDHPDLAPNLNVGLSTSFVPLPGEGTPDYVLPDPFSHGTHVAGSIAAADNAFGVIGVAPDAELVFVKVLSEVQGSGAFSWVIEGILYAADNGADVINMSLGTIIPQGSGADSAEIAALRVAVNKAITYAYRNGATTIVSAGNDGLDLNSPETASFINFNGYASHAISISAVGPEGWALDPVNVDYNNQAFYTNVGTEIDFAGQGGTVDFDLLASGQGCVVAGLARPCYVFDFVFSTGSLGSWYWSIGTSMAAPHAAGVAALIIGENGGEMKPSAVKREMRQRAEDLGPRGVDDLFGSGLVTSGY
jgi:subtilisin family serine protease